MTMLDSKTPRGSIEEKWDNAKFDNKLVNLTNANTPSLLWEQVWQEQARPHP
jgi:hypothetical protein